MNTTTPNIVGTVKSTQSGEAKIAVAIVSFPEEFPSIGYWILNNAILAGLKRASVNVISHGSYFLPVFAVVAITVCRENRAEALEAMKQTLAEVDVLQFATIATFTADDSWVTIHGLGIGGTAFEKTFMRPEMFESALKNFDEAKKASESKFAALIALIEKSAASEGGESPESK